MIMIMNFDPRQGHYLHDRGGYPNVSVILLDESILSTITTVTTAQSTGHHPTAISCYVCNTVCPKGDVTSNLFMRQA